MTRHVQRTFNRNIISVATVHPQVGPLDRGWIWSDRNRDGAGAYGVWRIADQDHEESPLLIVGDYLTAEAVLLDATTWADQPIPADELNGD